MKTIICLASVSLLLVACNSSVKQEPSATEKLPIQGTWKLISGTTIEKNDTTITDYSKERSFIKIINATHFAFLGHDLNKGKDSAFFSSGGGKYELDDTAYTEHLEYSTHQIGVKGGLPSRRPRVAVVRTTESLAQSDRPAHAAHLPSKFEIVVSHTSSILVEGSNRGYL